MSVINGHTCIGDDGGTPNRKCEGCEREKEIGVERKCDRCRRPIGLSERGITVPFGFIHEGCAE